jgi:hypothetical protein
MEPETLLWLSVLLQAKDDLSGAKPRPGSKRWRLRQNALNWIESPGYSPGSLGLICDHLGLDVSYVRSRLVLAAGYIGCGRKSRAALCAAMSSKAPLAMRRVLALSTARILASNCPRFSYSSRISRIRRACTSVSANVRIVSFFHKV